MLEAGSWILLVSAGLSAYFFVRHLQLFQRSPASDSSGVVDAVSVLIPARDEALRIAATVRAVLANVNVACEVVVLDDHSQDQTASLVAALAVDDPRVRLVSGRPLPRGWCGKQFACAQLADAAQHPVLLFLDADVTLTPDALRRLMLERQRTGVALLSGFPRQVVGSLGEGLLIPMIYLVLLTYLPFRLMRSTRMPAASAGCGQLFLTTRAAYQSMGGHAAIAASLHDGVTLPRAYRQAGLATDIVDARDTACCRMYHGWREACHGVLKNAHEGLANPRLLPLFTLLLLAGYGLPPLWCLGVGWWSASSTTALTVGAGAAVLAYLPRLITAARYDRAWGASALFPLGVLGFLALQWVALFRHWRGAPATWRGRAYEPDSVPLT